jgi:hypothetical protein
MALNKITSAENIGLETPEEFSVDPIQTKTSIQTIEFNEPHGYYRKIPELQGVIDRLALWVIYGGDDADEKNEEITFKTEADRTKFERITGFGKDTPEDVFYNLFRVGKISGTTIGEIIKDRANKKGLINLKPLDPQTIRVTANKFGIISKFEQITHKSGEDGQQLKPTELKPENVFYIAWNRIADEIVGISTIEKIEGIIKYRHQAMEDLSEVYHRYVVPFWLFYVDTDDEEEIDDFNTKIRKMIKERDSMTLPQGVVNSHERLSVPQHSNLDPLNWIKHLERYFLISEGVPELIAGIGRETADASSRMIYLAWRIITIANQKIYEKHIKRQLGINLRFPRPINILAPEISEHRTQVLGKEEIKPKKEKKEKKVKNERNNIL